MFKKRGAVMILSVLLVAVLLPCSAFGAVKSTAKEKAPSALKGFSAYSSDKDNIYLHWQLRSEGDGVLIYRSSSADGTYRQIGKVKLSEGEFRDSKVEAGKTYYYKARPYKLYKGKMIKGKYTVVKKKRAFHDNPCIKVVEYPTTGKMTCEPVFKVTMDEYSYDTELELEGAEMTFSQTVKNGQAIEKRTALLEMIGFSTDGVTWQKEGTVTVSAGETIYIKAYNPDGLEILEDSMKDWYLRCSYNGEDAVLELNPA